MHGIEPDNKNQKRGTKMKLTDKIHKKKNTQEIENFTDLVKARYSARSMSERSCTTQSDRMQFTKTAFESRNIERRHSKAQGLYTMSFQSIHDHYTFN